MFIFVVMSVKINPTAVLVIEASMVCRFLIRYTNVGKKFEQNASKNDTEELGLYCKKSFKLDGLYTAE